MARRRWYSLPVHRRHRAASCTRSAVRRLADELCQRRPREVAVLIVDSFDARAIDRPQFASEQVKLTAQNDEFPEYLPKGGMVHPARVGDRLVI